MKNDLYIVTGANGHLGKTIVKLLCEAGKHVRGLILQNEQFESIAGVKYYSGDIRNKNTLEPLFLSKKNLYVIHTAGIIDICEKTSPLLKAVNVLGTKNIIELCIKHSVKRLIHVSSVHAIPEKEALEIIDEVNEFSSEAVIGTYAKTKAEASQIVLEASKAGLDAVIVHPSGIIGPNDDSNNNFLVQMISDFISGKLLACVNGGYDFVDVRDVAKGCILALEKGKSGECYILSNRYYKVAELLKIVQNIKKSRRLPSLPMWFAEFLAPFFECGARLLKKRPLFTQYSLHTLKARYFFSHDKATSELGFRPRNIQDTIKDTITWILQKANIKNCTKV